MSVDDSVMSVEDAIFPSGSLSGSLNSDRVRAKMEEAQRPS